MLLILIFSKEEAEMLLGGYDSPTGKALLTLLTDSATSKLVLVLSCTQRLLTYELILGAQVAQET
jgi:hypothetical protein